MHLCIWQYYKRCFAGLIVSVAELIVLRIASESVPFCWSSLNSIYNFLIDLLYTLFSNRIITNSFVMYDFVIVTLFVKKYIVSFMGGTFFTIKSYNSLESLCG